MNKVSYTNIALPSSFTYSSAAGNRTGLKAVCSLALVLSSILVIGFSLAEAFFAVLMSYLVFGAFGFMIARAYDAERLYLLVFCVSVMATIGIYYIYLNRYGTPYIGGGSDDLNYEEYAELLAAAPNMFLYNREGIRYVVALPYHNSPGYIYTVSLLVHLGKLMGGFHTIMPRLLNSMLLGLCSVFMFLIAKQLQLGIRQATIVALATGLFPMMIFIAAHTFRDIIIVFILILTLYQAIALYKAKNLARAIWATAIIILLTMILLEFRYLYILFTVAMLCTGWYVRFERRIRNSILIFAFLVAVIAILTIVPSMLFEGKYALSASAGIAIYNEDLAVRSDGLSQQLFSLSFPWNIAGRLAYASITPLPILYTDWEWTILGMGSLLQFFYFPFVFLGIEATYKDRRFWPLLVGFGIIFAGYVFGTFTFRHLVAVIPFAALFAIIGYTKYRSLRRPIWKACFFVLLLATFAYLVLKGVF